MTGDGKRVDEQAELEGLEHHTKGGLARAAALSAVERRNIARRAAQARWHSTVPMATHEGSLRIGDLDLQCAVVDGQRLISESSALRAFGLRPSAKLMESASLEGEEPVRLPMFVGQVTLRPFIDNELLILLTKPVAYRSKGGGKPARGLDATLIPRVCDVWLRARDSGVLRKNQLRIAAKADALVRALAKTGIVALIDEVTGYQEVRDRLALQRILDLYLRKEFAAWAKCFPDEFYREIFRLRAWEWPSLKGKGPRVLAAYTNDIVYSRLAPGILDELEHRTPIEDGRRAAKHHQFLTLDIGHPALAAHLHATMALMRASSSWEQFKVSLDLAFPRITKLSDLPLFNPPTAIGPGQPS